MPKNKNFNKNENKNGFQFNVLATYKLQEI